MKFSVMGIRASCSGMISKKCIKILWSSCYRDDFREEHIESACILFFGNLSRNAAPVHPLQFQRYARSLGVDSDCHVILYDRGDMIWATYAFWIFTVRLILSQFFQAQNCRKCLQEHFKGVLLLSSLSKVRRNGSRFGCKRYFGFGVLRELTA